MHLRKWLIFGCVSAGIAVLVYFYFQRPRVSQRTRTILFAETSRPPEPDKRFADCDLLIDGTSAFSQLTLPCNDEVDFQFVTETVPPQNEIWALHCVPRLQDADEDDFRMVDWGVDRPFTIETNPQARQKKKFTGRFDHNLKAGTYLVRYFLRSDVLNMQTKSNDLPEIYFLGQGLLTVPEPVEGAESCDSVPLQNDNTFDPAKL